MTFWSAARSTIVCDTGDEARHLAFGQERHKVVTKDGLLISKSGAMTGGGTAQIADKAGRFDEAEQLRMREVSHNAKLPQYDHNRTLLVPNYESYSRFGLSVLALTSCFERRMLDGFCCASSLSRILRGDVRSLDFQPTERSIP